MDIDRDDERAMTPAWVANAIDDGRCAHPPCVQARTKLRELVWRAEQVRQALAADASTELDRHALRAWLDTTDARALFEGAGAASATPET